MGLPELVIILGLVALPALFLVVLVAAGVALYVRVWRRRSGGDHMDTDLAV